MLSLITDKEYRLCSERYRMKDLIASSPSSSSGGATNTRDFAARYVFPYDAEDLKAHKWFRHIPWERLHQIEPPLVPKLRSVNDTHYFDDSGSITDESGTGHEDDEVVVYGAHDGAAEGIPEIFPSSPGYSMQSPGWSPACYPLTTTLVVPPTDHNDYFQTYNNYPTPPLLPSLESPVTSAHFSSAFPVQPSQEHFVMLRRLPYTLQNLALTILSTPPHDIETKMHALEVYLEQLPSTTDAERVCLQDFFLQFTPGGAGRGDKRKQERKRARDKLLRDRETKAVAMEVRRRTAFLGYEWVRMRKANEEEEPCAEERTESVNGGGCGLDGEAGANSERKNDGLIERLAGLADGEQEARGGHLLDRLAEGWETNVGVMRAMYSGPWSTR
ncbi:hypothetical protein B0J18DRAFT_415123 [Chaetomium sp. MPI-SDFR-AT-0129]|nr:hypothetical protein B0J18DRAFT_415123 [Chaetomium sp. MPI-SDFR-AT-0129]